MTAVFRREIEAMFKSVTGYLFSAFLLLFVGIYTMAYNLSGYTANFAYAVSAVSFVYLLAVPFLTMRSLAEEKRQKTDQLLYSLPISMTDVVMGKYLALLVTLLVPVAVTALYPLLLSRFGTVPMAVSYGTLFAFFMLGACLTSIGLFISAVTENQVVSAVVTLAVMLVLYFMSGLSSYVSTEAASSLFALCVLMIGAAALLWALTKNVPVALTAGVVGLGGIYLWYRTNEAAFEGLFKNVMEKLSVFERFYTFSGGVFDLTAIVYYLSITAVFLFMTVQAMEKRRWNA